MFYRIHVRNKRLSLKSFERTYSVKNHIVTSGFPNIEIPKVTLPEFLEPYQVKFEKFTAIECYQTKRKYTYSDLRKKSTSLAKGLKKKLKLQVGDAVAVILPNLPEFPLASLGILKANLVVTTISIHFTADEISKQLIDSNAKAIITDVGLSTIVKKSLQLASRKVPILAIKTENNQSLPDNTIDFHQFVNETDHFSDLTLSDSENVAFIPYSSGTTGLPKGVLLTHRNTVANLLQNNLPELTFKTEASENYQEVLPSMLPFYHVFGHLGVMYNTTLHGGKLITLPKYSSNDYISMLKDNEDSSILYLVPPIGYGLSEATTVVTSLFPQILTNLKDYTGSVGIPIVNTEVKIVDINDPKDTPLGPDCPGELLFKGPQLMKGYHNRPEDTKRTITEDGWCRTGDVGYYNEKGFVFITDRYKELIKVKGNQVPPAEIEAVVREYPGVLDAAVIGIPHETYGEVPRGYVSVNDPENFDPKKLDEFVNEKLAKYKRLAGGIVVVDEIPRNASGKIMRRIIREEFIKNGK